MSLPFFRFARNVRNATVPLVMALVLVAPATPAAHAQAAPFANLFATVSAPSGFPFPQNFHADVAIAVHDTNHNGFLDPARGSSTWQFPVSFPSPPGTPQAGGTGNHIGSPIVEALAGSTQAQQDQVTATFGTYCGDILVYGEEHIAPTTYFIWFALPDPNSPPKPAPCNPKFPYDLGIGSYQGSYASPSNWRLATFFGGGLADTSLGAIHAHVTEPTAAAPNGHVYSISPDPTVAWPFALNGPFVAAEILNDIAKVQLSNLTIDVPLIEESQWDGTSMYQTDYPIARSIQPIAGQPTTPAASCQSIALTTPQNVSPQPVGAIIHLVASSAQPDGCSLKAYRFLVTGPGGGQPTQLYDGPGDDFEWATSGLAYGVYQLSVQGFSDPVNRANPVQSPSVSFTLNYGAPPAPGGGGGGSPAHGNGRGTCNPCRMM